MQKLIIKVEDESKNELFQLLMPINHATLLLSFLGQKFTDFVSNMPKSVITEAKPAPRFSGEKPWSAIVNNKGLNISEEESFQRFVQMKIDVENKGRVLSLVALDELQTFFDEWRKYSPTS